MIDHHLADEALPPALAVVNPNRLDDLSGLGHLAAVGLVFMTVVAVNRELRARGFWTAQRPEPDLLALLDLVALGTVADVVPLKGLNRAFVAKGLLALRRRDNPGLTALMDVARLGGPPEPWHLGFLHRPAHQCRRPHRAREPWRRSPPCARIRPSARASPPSSTASTANARRSSLPRSRRPRPRPYAALGLEEKGAVVVTAAEGWHPGVVGLVAARLKEKFGRPAFAIALEPGGIGTGSGRSIAGVDLGRVVREAVREGLLIKGGGHAMAAGVTLRKDALAPFRAFLEDSAWRNGRHRAARGCAPHRRRAHGGRRDARDDRDARARGPFGAGNPEPVVALPAHTLAYADEVGQAHMRVRLRAGDGSGINAIAFRAVGQKLGAALTQHRGQAVHAAGSLAIDRWQGEERVQFRLIDIAPADAPGG